MACAYSAPAQSLSEQAMIYNQWAAIEYIELILSNITIDAYQALLVLKPNCSGIQLNAPSLWRKMIGSANIFHVSSKWFDLCLKKTVEQATEAPVIWDVIALIMTSL